MFFDGQFRHIGTVDPQPLVRAVDALGEDAWHDYVRRQEKFEPHRQTLSIPLLYDDDMRHADPTPWDRLAALDPVIQPVLDTIRAAHAPAAGTEDKGYFIRIILTTLLPGSVITPHRDYGPSMLRSHRYHLALVTNDQSSSRSGARSSIWRPARSGKSTIANCTRCATSGPRGGST